MPFTSGGVGYGSVGFLQGARSAQEKAEAKRAEQAKEDLGLYKELIKHGWSPPDDKAVEDGSVVRFKGLGYLKPPRFDKAKAFELKLKTMESAEEIARLRVEAQKLQNIGNRAVYDTRVNLLNKQIELAIAKAQNAGDDAGAKELSKLMAQLTVATRFGGVSASEAAQAIVTPEILEAKRKRLEKVDDEIGNVHRRIQDTLEAGLKYTSNIARNPMMLMKVGEDMMKTLSRDIKRYRATSIGASMDRLHDLYRKRRDIEEGATVRVSNPKTGKTYTRPRNSDEEEASLFKHFTPNIVAWYALRVASTLRNPADRWELITLIAQNYADVRGMSKTEVMDQVAGLIYFYKPTTRKIFRGPLLSHELGK